MKLLTMNSERKRARILVVNEDAAIAESLSKTLEGDGYSVVTASSGQEALATAKQFRPDLLVSEVCMTGVNGVETASRITAKMPACRVLFLSSHGSITDVLSAAPKRLVYSFISKPLHRLDLLNAIAYLLSGVSSADDSELSVTDRTSTARYAITTKSIEIESAFREVENDVGPYEAA